MSRDDIEEQIRLKMNSRGIDPEAIERFLSMVRRIREGPSTYVPLDEVSTPAAGLILDAASLERNRTKLEARGKSLLSKVAVIKLNGGRSTTMGGVVPKGILKAKGGRSYLEIIIGQMLAIRERWCTDIPLLLMNSFFTHGPTMETVSRFDLPVRTFIQNQVPRLIAETLAPLETGTDEDWAPPGHGDVYASLHQRGLLDRLRAEGFRWAFISNLDNLAACLEPWILGLIEQEGAEFLLEVTDRTSADRKGGTLVIRNGRLDLLEIAQVAPADRDSFMDIERFRVFNTNNVWINLEALAKALKENMLKLPLIQNHKIIASTQVIQLETAMGAAIGWFPNVRGLKVGRDRFFPTKKVADLFVLQSDACVLDSMDRLQRNPVRPAPLPLRPRVVFSQDFLNSAHTMSECFEEPSSVSLVRAHCLKVSGRVFFERDIKIEGKVEISGPPEQVCRIPRGSVLRDCKYP